MTDQTHLIIFDLGIDDSEMYPSLLNSIFILNRVSIFSINLGLSFEAIIQGPLSEELVESLAVSSSFFYKFFYLWEKFFFRTNRIQPILPIRYTHIAIVE